jgi:hypothetical protein
MALSTPTTLSADFPATASNLGVASATGATVGGLVKVDNEYSLITKITGTTISVIQRGLYGGAAVAHDALAPVVFGLQADFPNPTTLQTIAEPVNADLLSVGENGVIPVPTRNTTYLLTKGSALASTTFANPTAGQNGLEVTFIGATDFAHVVTLVSGFDGTTGTSTTFTSAAFKGSSVTLVAYNAQWLVKSNNLFVIT